jgi:hypothetical protein
MKSIVAPLLLAVVFVAAGGVFWITGRADERVASVHEQLATLQYAAASSIGTDVEQSLDLERRVPILGAQAVADVHDATTTAKYWQADFAGVMPQHDATGAVNDTDPTILLLAANAAFRASQTAADRADTLRRLDGAIKGYTDALKSAGQPIDAAYNYEFAVRTRDSIGKSRPAAAARNAVARKPADEPSDLPAGPTLHGRPGGPPAKTEMSQFKIVIPKRGEERKDNPEAGKGGQKVRKG